MLCLHIPSLIPQHFSSIDVASTVQAAAVVGAGLLYQGSSHRMMTEFLLNELGKRPSSDANVTDREAYTLSCGLALGMVNLSKGAKTNNDSGANAGLADLRIEERLFRYVLGGVDNNEMRRRKDEHDRFGIPLGAALNERCSCVVEGEAVNTDVTAPGATLALGLIYMKTGNQTIASAVSLPDTHFLLEYVRPDFLLLRVVARAMILWENVLPSSDWIESQLPTVVSQAFSQMKRTAMKNAGYIDGVDEGYVDVSQDYDRQAIRQIHCHIIAGACFALGLRYAGTGDREATEAISLKILELLDLRDAVDPVSKALRPTSSALELSLGCAATSLAMVQAGTGDLEVLRLLKVIRWRSDDEINYGLHMTYGSAIGLLFLGGGKCTLGRDPEDIAAMIAAFFPRYPSRTSDNQFHLQALRHMYALAVKHREFRAVDVDTGESVFVPFEVYFSDRTVAPLKLTAPCLLCNSDNDPAEIKINCERYYPLSFKLDKVASGRIFYVKKRSAHLTYGQDPNSQRSLLLQTGSYMGKDFLDLVGSFTEDAQILSFAKYFCSLDMIPSNKKSSGSDLFSLAAFSARILHQCMAHDSEEAIFLYLAIRSAINSVIENSDGSGRSVWDYRLIRTYFQRRPSIAVGSSSKLVNEELAVYLCDMFESNLSQDAHLSTYYALPLDQEGLTGSLAQGKAIDDMDTS
jgi:anaphase-promoting complex subunit 1